MRADVVARLVAQRLAEELMPDVAKGEDSGHDFRGNQWTGGIGGDNPGEIMHAGAGAVGMTSRQRQDEALRLRNLGLTLQQISDKLQFNSPQAARQAIIAAQARAGGAQPQPEPQPQPTTQPPPEAPTPQPQTATGPTLADEQMAQLQQAYADAQSKYDAIGREMINGQLSTAERYGQSLQVVEDLGNKVTEAVNARFAEIAPPLPENMMTTQQVEEAKQAVRDQASNLDIGERVASAAMAIQENLGADLAPLYRAALAEAGVPEGHAAYEIANDPGRLYGLVQSADYRGVSVAGTEVMIRSTSDGYRVTMTNDNNFGGNTAVFSVEPLEDKLKSFGMEMGLNATTLKNYGSEVTNAVTNALGGRVMTSTGMRSTWAAERPEVTAAVRALLPPGHFDALQKDNAALVKMMDETLSKATEARVAAKAYEAEASKVYTDLLFNTIGSMRPLAEAGSYPLGKVQYGTPRDSGMTQAEGKRLTQAAIERATTRLPKDWVDNINKRYGASGISIKFKSADGSGWWKNWSGEIYVGRTAANPGPEVAGRASLDSTLLHEMTHSAQQTNEEAHQLELAYMREVGTGRITVLPGYTRGTTGDVDNFTRVYSGRAYNGDFREVLTTGMEGMITPSVVSGETPHEESFGGNTSFQNFMTGTLLLASRSSVSQ